MWGGDGDDTAVPGRSTVGAAEAAAQLRSWFSGAERIELLESEVRPISRRFGVSYRFKEYHSNGETGVIEQEAFCDVRQGLIESIDILCSGHLLEADLDAAVRDTPRHRFDSGELGCGSGLPQEFRRRMDEVPVGHLREVVTRDPSAREDRPSLARLIGHQVISVGTAANGRTVVVVKRGR